MSTNATQSLYFEPFDLSCRTGLFETFTAAASRSAGTTMRIGVWSVVRLDDLRSMYTRQDVFSNRPNGAETINPPVDFEIPEVAERLLPVFDTMLLDTHELLSAPVIVGADPPLHTRIRSTVNRAFTRGRIQSLPRIH